MKHIPYGKQTIDETDIKAVADVLRSDWLTTGPSVSDFECAVADYVGAQYGVAVSSGTAALHCAMYALGIGPGDEVIVPVMTFAASANCVVYQGGTPVFVDVTRDSLLIDVAKIEEKITPRTKAIIAVDYAGHPCDYDALKTVADRHQLKIVSDGCHALGAVYRGKNVGTLADMTVFSFHPVKHITTGEGGMIVTDDKQLYERMCRFRNHGISRDAHERNANDTWHYDIPDLGFNYRLTDFQCALGASQLKRVDSFLSNRRKTAAFYDASLRSLGGVEPLEMNDDIAHAYHLYVIRFDTASEQSMRDRVFGELRQRRIGVNVHYIPVHLLSYYRNRFDTAAGMCPVAEEAYQQILSLPIYPSMSGQDAAAVVDALSIAVG